MNSTLAKPLDTGTRLAVDRTRLAYERTLMAWVRTATSLISFGFTIYKFFEFESGKGAVAEPSSHLLTPRQFGMIMIGTGLIALALATFDHYRNEKRMREEYGPMDRSVALGVAAIVSAMGLLALLAALFRG
jgi:putative membrane protein